MNERGFTLIELLIVIVVIGILATLAIPRLGQTRDRAFVAAMQSDLRQLMIAQELYFQSNDFVYFTDDPVQEAFPFDATDGVTIRLSSRNPARGYSAEASHSRVDVVCTLSMEEGERPSGIQCTDPTRDG